MGSLDPSYIDGTLNFGGRGTAIVFVLYGRFVLVSSWPTE